MAEINERTGSILSAPSLIDSYQHIADMKERLTALRDLLQDTLVTPDNVDIMEQRDKHVRVLGSYVLLTERMTAAVESRNPVPPTTPTP